MATKGVQPSRSQRRDGNCLGQHQRLLSEATAKGQMKLPRASSRTASAGIGLREDILSLSLAFPPLFLKNPRHLYLLKGMRLTAGILYYVVFSFCDTCRWKQSATIFNFVTTFGENWKALQRSIQTSFALLMCWLQLIHLKDFILCLTSSWWCLCGVEREILPTGLRRKRFGVTISSLWNGAAMVYIGQNLGVTSSFSCTCRNNSLVCHC